MNYTPVQSSNIDAVAFDAATSTLGVRFKNGGTYHYADVPQSVYDEFLAASSIGKFFFAHIKGKYTCEKVG